MSYSNFVVDVVKYIKFYSLFIKSFTIHRTIKVPGTFKFFTISHPCNKAHIVFCYMVYQSYILLNLWQVLFSPGKLVPPPPPPHMKSTTSTVFFTFRDMGARRHCNGEDRDSYVEAINGRIQFIDTIIGIPYLDMTNLICSDLWLL